MAPRRGLQSLLRTCGRAAPLIDHSLPGPPWLESHVPNTCRNQLDARLIRSSDGLRLPVYKTAALPTELHRRVTRCLVAHPEGSTSPPPHAILNATATPFLPRLLVRTPRLSPGGPSPAR